MGLAQNKDFAKTMTKATGRDGDDVGRTEAEEVFVGYL
jgi:hypothetical protein